MRTVFTALGAFSGCAAARWYLDRSSRREADLLGGHVRLTALWNEGAAFGLPLSGRVLGLGSAAALGAVWANRKRWHPAGAGLILGGGLSNLWERALHGRVYDYARFPKAVCVQSGGPVHPGGRRPLPSAGRFPAALTGAGNPEEGGGGR